MAALLGSAGHAGPNAAQRIAGLFVSFSVGFIRPPSLTYEQVRLPATPTINVL